MFFVERQSNLLGIYIHFPFCIQKCYYCDFYSVGVNEIPQSIQEIEDIFVRRILQELDYRYPYFSEFKNVNTVYFGGGTSSFLSARSLNTILEGIQKYFSFTDTVEITLEGNPEHLYNTEYLKELKSTGINRINAGIQTGNFHFLESMNRFYRKEHYERVLDSIASHFENWGVDLIYGYPSQTFEEFLKDISWVLNYPVKHLSLYSLTVEKGTQFEKLIKTNKAKPPNVKLQEQIFISLPHILEGYGFFPYEVSNYSRKGYECRHNLRYWLYEPYMGLGPSAHGFNGYFRYNNFRNWQKWLQSFYENYTIHEPEKEVAITMLRLLIPISWKWIQDITKEAMHLFSFFERLKERNLGKILHINSQNYFLWHYSGIQILDSILLELFAYLDERKSIQKLK